jgi:hypothetical protein
MTDAKQPTPAMPAKDDPASTPRGDGEADGLIPRDTRGAGGGGPTGPKDAGKHGFHGGQSDAAYFGHGQLGDEEVEGESNPNAPSEEP